MQALQEELLGFVGSPQSDAFDDLARRVASAQVEAIPSYGRLAAARGWSGDRWRQAPLVPTEAFRELDLTAPARGTAAIFHTSGTSGTGHPGVRRVVDLSLYHAAMVEPFVQQVLAGSRTRRPWVSLIPSAEDAPHSSLSHMVQILAADLADLGQSHWCLAAGGLDTARAADALEGHAKAGRPVVLLTTAFALVNLFDAAPAWSVSLGAGSRMMLTGGFKGRSRTLSQGALRASIASRLGLAPDQVVDEYGMTEMTSQAYGSPLEPPPWLRLRVLDPRSLEDLPPGEEGVVAVFDLLNLHNVSALLTGDRGILDEQGRLLLLGRMPQAPRRGCSLTAEELGVAAP